MHNILAAAQLDKELAAVSLEERIRLIAERFDMPVFTTSLGMEDQVLTWAIAQHGRSIRLATLQTGRLFEETLSLISTTKERYGLPIVEYKPDQAAVDAYVAKNGADGFYYSIEARKACCAIRKVIPLEKALAGADVWITGLRRGQSDNRQSIPMAEWDAAHQIMKINPLADWNAKQIRETIVAHDIPVNPLHGRNYPSIGCEPCTRAIKPGEPERAGRWWWEQNQTQECGLHVGKKAAAILQPENA